MKIWHSFNRDMKEQDVYLGEMPLMTPNGTFVVNGVERVIVSQMHRSPGVFFDHDKGKTHASGKFLFAARVIPYRGSWLDFEFDPKDIINVRIDRRRKILCSTLLMALPSKETEEYINSCKEKNISPKRSKMSGMTKEEILNIFYDRQLYELKDAGWVSEFNQEKLKNTKLKFDLVNADDGNVVATTEDKLTPRFLKKLEEGGLKNILINDDELVGSYLAEDIINISSGEVLFEAGDLIDKELLSSVKSLNIKNINILIVDGNNVGPWMLNTIQNDKNFTRRSFSRYLSSNEAWRTSRL